MAVRAQAVDRGTPADYRAALTQPAPDGRNTAVGHIASVNRGWLVIGVAAGDLTAARQREDPALMTGRASFFT